MVRQPFDISRQSLKWIYLFMAFNGRFILNIAHLASRQGGNIKEFVELSGKSLEELGEEACIVENANYNAILELAVKTTTDHHFGLHAGEHLNLSAAGLIVQLAQTSETVKQALELCCQFANLGCSALPLGLEEKKDCYKVTFTPDQLWKGDSEIAFQHTTAGVIAFTIKEFHSLTRMQHHPIAVHLSWSDKEGAAEYERVFGCPVSFGANEVAVLLKKEHVEDTVITSDYKLLQMLVAHAEEMSSNLDHEKGFAALVAQSIIKLVKPEFPTIEEVAGHLNVSSRTLQRRLQDEGLTYKKVMDELRKDFAIGYLKRPDLTIGDIAYLLSYSDTSAFTRSFKRWTGKNPNAYRARLN
jgi:AraC-like DNA-binding protein